MGVLDHFLNAAEAYMRLQRLSAARAEEEKESRPPRKRRVKGTRDTRLAREFDAAPLDADDPGCCTAKR